MSSTASGKALWYQYSELPNESHHLMVELGDREIFDAEAFKRIVGAVLLSTAVGVPLIWMGEEFGEYKPKT